MTFPEFHLLDDWQREKKVSAVGRHGVSLCTQKQLGGLEDLFNTASAARMLMSLFTWLGQQRTMDSSLSSSWRCYRICCICMVSD